MTITTLKRATAAILTPALLITATPIYAATSSTAKAKAPMLACKTAGTDGLTYTVIKAGNGEKPGADAKVKVNYKGMLTSDGSEFDSGQGAEFRVGGVIAGFAQGLQLMQPGGRYRLCIPSELGYGETGTGPIPADADLVFEVELLSFTMPPPKPVIPVAERACSQSTASGLGFDMVKDGSGRAPTDADMALVDFTVFDASSGVVQQKREWEKVPLTQASAIFAEGLKMMQIGATYRFCVPKPTDPQAVPEPDNNILVTLLDLRPAPLAEN